MTPALISAAPLPPYPNLVSGAPRKHLPSLLDLVSFSFHSTESSKSASNHIKLGNARQRFVSNSSKAKGTCQNSISSQITGHRISLHPPSLPLGPTPPPSALAGCPLVDKPRFTCSACADCFPATRAGAPRVTHLRGRGHSQTSSTGRSARSS